MGLHYLTRKWSTSALLLTVRVGKHCVRLLQTSPITSGFSLYFGTAMDGLELSENINTQTLIGTRVSVRLHTHSQW